MCSCKCRMPGDQKLTEPVVDPQIGEEVPNRHVRPAESLSEEEEGRGGDGNANVAHDDQPSVAVLVQRAAGVKVVHAAAEAVLLALATTLTLALVVVVARHVGEEVVGPADDLLADEVDERGNGRLLGQLVELVGEPSHPSGLLLAGARDEDHVALDVARRLVVLGVAELPAEVGDEEGRVQDPADNVVEALRGREGTVAALVGKDPETGAEEALEEGVRAPEDDADGLGGDELGRDIVVPEVKGGGEEDHVAEDIAHAADVGPLEAVLGDGIADVLDGVVGHLELVAVRVDELAVRLWHGLHVGLGSHRREGGGRGGAARGVGGRGIGCGRGRVGGGHCPLDGGNPGSLPARGGGGGHVGRVNRGGRERVSEKRCGAVREGVLRAQGTRRGAETMAFSA